MVMASVQFLSLLQPVIPGEDPGSSTLCAGDFRAEAPTSTESTGSRLKAGTTAEYRATPVSPFHALELFPCPA